MQIEVKFFPAQQVKNNYLGGGYINSGGLSTRFTAFANPKFSKGFSIALPTRKNGSDIVEEVKFVNREASDAAYNALEPQLRHLLGGQAAAPQQQSYQAPQQPSREVKPPSQVEISQSTNAYDPPF